MRGIDGILRWIVWMVHSCSTPIFLLMIETGEAPTQRFARNLIAEGYNGLLVRSFAKGAGLGDMNLVLWKWSASGPSRLELIDDEDRLG